MRNQRSYAYDNLRSVMVLFIVLLHAACAYAMGTLWWHAQDEKSVLFDVIIVIIDAFALPVLFFIAGLFAYSTYERHGKVGFVRNKLKRLGIPLLVMPVIYLPAMVYVGYANRVDSPKGFLEYWLHWVASLSDWSAAVITSMETGVAYADIMSPHHLWFISVLLLFFIGYALFRPLFTVKIHVSAGWLAVLTAVFIFVGFTGINLLVQDWAWARFGPFILFQPTRIPVYLGMFLLGVLARPRMDRSRPFPGVWWGWMIVFLAALFVLLAMVQTLMAPGPAPIHIAVVHGMVRAVLAVAAVVLFVSLGTSRLASPSRWRESLSASSYDIYLWHMPLVVFVQALLVEASMPLEAKALTAFVVPLMVIWSVSRLVDRIDLSAMRIRE